MNQILAMTIVLVGAACCHGQTAPPVSPSPDKSIIATVPGKDITAKDASQLNGIVFGTLLEKYADENKIVPTEAELDTFLVAMERGKKEHQLDLDTRKASSTKDLESSSLSE